MSAGFVHAKASLFLAAGFSIGALISQDPKILSCTLGALAGILLAPDLDVDNGNISNKIIKEKAGWFGEKVWRLFWRGYSRSFKHGQFGSHFPVFSTFVRLSYIFFVAIIPFYILYFFVLQTFGLHFYFRNELMWWARAILNPLFFYGLCGSDTIHFFLDVLTTEHKV